MATSQGYAHELCYSFRNSHFHLQSNVLINGRGEPLLADFGLSFLGMELTESSYFSSCKPGNVRWAAPELFIDLPDGSPCRACVKSDIYSVGCVMLQVCELVTLYRITNVLSPQHRFFLAACPTLCGPISRSSVRSSRARNLCDSAKLLLMTAIGNS